MDGVGGWYCLRGNWRLRGMGEGWEGLLWSCGGR